MSAVTAPTPPPTESIKSPAREIASIAVPVSLEMVIQLVLTFINQIIVGTLGAVAVAAVGLSGYMVRKVRKTFARSLVWSGACGTAGCLACAGSLLSSPGSFQKAFWIGLAVAFMMGLSGTRNFPELLGLAIRVLSALKDESKQTKKSDGE